MDRRPMTRNASLTLARLHAARQRDPAPLFRVGVTAVRQAELPVETLYLHHPGLGASGLEVDEADVIELCEHAFIEPRLDDQLAVVAFVLGHLGEEIPSSDHEAPAVSSMHGV